MKEIGRLISSENTAPSAFSRPSSEAEDESGAKCLGRRGMDVLVNQRNDNDIYKHNYRRSITL